MLARILNLANGRPDDSNGYAANARHGFTGVWLRYQTVTLRTKLWSWSRVDAAAAGEARSVTSVTRIVAGRFGGRRLTAPPGTRTRPTSERVREALFSTVESLLDLDGARFADLYAGSGVVGLEAFSRGASQVLLVESDPRAARVARANIAALGGGDRVRLVTAPARAVLANGPEGGQPYQVVFADPPYNTGAAELTAVQHALVERGWLAPDGLVVIERSRHSTPLTWVDSITPSRERRYGDTTLWYGRRS